MVKEGIYITDASRKRFKRFLADQEISMTTFAKRCGVSRQYIGFVIHGKRKITSTVREWFKKGGYDLF